MLCLGVLVILVILLWESIKGWISNKYVGIYGSKARFPSHLKIVPMCKSAQVRLNHTKRRVCNIRIWLISWLHNNFNNYIPFPYLPIKMAHINHIFPFKWLIEINILGCPINAPSTHRLIGHHETIFPMAFYHPRPTFPRLMIFNEPQFFRLVSAGKFKWKSRNPKWPFLVGGWPTPLEKWWSKSQLGLWHSQYSIYGNIKFMFLTTKQIFHVNLIYTMLKEFDFLLGILHPKKTATNTNSIRDNATKPARKSGPVIQRLGEILMVAGILNWKNSQKIKETRAKQHEVTKNMLKDTTHLLGFDPDPEDI